MSGLYVYGISGDAPRGRSKGVFGRPLRTIAVGRLHVVVESAIRPPQPTIATLKAQSRVLARLVTDGLDLLPARFGSFVADREELTLAIRARDGELRHALGKIRGRVQMTIRVRVTSEPETPRSSGRLPARTGAAYLRARAARESARRSHPLVRAIERAAAPFARASRVEWHDSPFRHVRVHHLVPRGRQDAYRDAMVRALAGVDAEAVLTGPWAPFAFVEIA